MESLLEHCLLKNYNITKLSYSIFLQWSKFKIYLNGCKRNYQNLILT
jgi:hypothetical protein